MFSRLYSKDKNINDPSKYNLTKDLIWASPRGFDLGMDIYTPTAVGEPMPVLAIFHGGGFLVRRRNIMNNMAQYIASNHKYVVCNIDYRLLRDQGNSVTFDELIGDAFGSILWIKENISSYGGDKDKVAVTGDSAGAYISAMIVNCGNNLGKKENYKENLSFEPSYLPKDSSFESLIKNNAMEVKAAILSYGGYDFYKWALAGAETYTNPFWIMALSKPRGIFGSEFSPEKNPEMYKAASPFYNIPHAEERQLPPQLLTGATKDRITPVGMIKEYLKELKDKGHQAEYWEHINRNHAYLDSGKTFIAGNDFKKDGMPALKVMMEFLDSIFYKQNQTI
tara:strand:- start:9028 stop:10038 length:1011 start_codon:yes stop_codon:yes gene_type:complete